MFCSNKNSLHTCANYLFCVNTMNWKIETQFKNLAVYVIKITKLYNFFTICLQTNTRKQTDTFDLKNVSHLAKMLVRATPLPSSITFLFENKSRLLRMKSFNRKAPVKVVIHIS